MLVHRTRADGATARQRDFRGTELGQQRAQHQNGSAHGLDQFVRRDVLVDGARINGDATALGQRAFVDADGGAQFTQQLHGGHHVVQMRHIGDLHRRIGQQRGAKDRQHCVLGAGNGDLAVQGGATGDYDLLHGLWVLGCWFWIVGCWQVWHGGEIVGLHQQPATVLYACSSGVTVFRASAWIAPPIRSPSVA